MFNLSTANDLFETNRQEIKAGLDSLPDHPAAKELQAISSYQLAAGQRKAEYITAVTEYLQHGKAVDLSGASTNLILSIHANTLDDYSSFLQAIPDSVHELVYAELKLVAVRYSKLIKTTKAILASRGITISLPQ